MQPVEAELRHGYRDVGPVRYNAWTSTGADALEGLIESVLARFGRRLLRRELNGLTLSTHRPRSSAPPRTALPVAAAPYGAAGIVDRFRHDLSVDAKARNDMREAPRDLARQWAQRANRGVRYRELSAEIAMSGGESYQRVDAVLRSGRRTPLPARPNARA